MTESVGDFICVKTDKTVHEDLELSDIEAGKHKGCGNEAVIWEYADREIKKAAKRQGVKRSYTVSVSSDGRKLFVINEWGGTY